MDARAPDVISHVTIMTSKRMRVWRVPPTWPPRALGMLGVSIALWGVFFASPSVGPCPEDLVTDWLTRDGGLIAVPMPPKRLERQQAPPCKPTQDEINGGCWSRLEQRAPCDQFYEYQGRCYVPVRETPKPPTSIGP